MKNLPKNFSTWDHSAKAGFLVRTGQARDFYAACALLAQCKRPAPRLPKSLAHPPVAEQWFNRGQYA